MQQQQLWQKLLTPVEPHLRPYTLMLMAKVDTLKFHLLPMDRKGDRVHAVAKGSKELLLAVAPLTFAPNARQSNEHHF